MFGRVTSAVSLLMACASGALGQIASESDVVVYSGVPCGIAAAIAAARNGAQVVLIEPNRHVGGLNTSGLNTAETEHMLTWTFGGIAQEFYDRMGRCYGGDTPAYRFESRGTLMLIVCKIFQGNR